MPPIFPTPASDRFRARAFGAAPVLAALAAALALTAAPARAEAPAAPLLRLSASGEAEAAPDAAAITIRAEATARTTGDAMAAASSRMRSVIAAVKALGIAEEDIATTDISLHPRMVRDAAGERTEHAASSSIRVETAEFAQLSAIVGAATDAGASHVDSPAFIVSDMTGLEEKARGAAIRALFAKAEGMACAAGMRIDRLVELAEEGAPGLSPQPRMAMAAVEMDRAAPPVEAGMRSATARVSGVWALAPAVGSECAGPQ